MDFSFLKRLFVYKHKSIPKDFKIVQEYSKNEGEIENTVISDIIKNEIKDKYAYPYVMGMVSDNIKENLAFIKDVFASPTNFDFIIREFKVRFKDEFVDAFLIFYDGLTNKDIINLDILKPLMLSGLEKPPNTDLADAIYKSMVSQAPLSKMDKVADIISAVGFGNCAIFVDRCKTAFIADVKGWSARSVDKPITEAVLTGPQEAFNEIIMTNIALIRKILKDSNLIAENIEIGNKSKTPCALMHIEGITNRSLVDEVRHRLKSIDIDYIYSSSDIEMLIEDSTLFPLPQIMKTERPDRAASMLANGKVVVIVQGSPFVLVLPATAVDLIETSEDNYVRVGEANFMRMVRLLGIALSVLLPSCFIAVALYHHETIPTNLLFAIEASREKVPFPIVFELVIMELSFELIKEASIRIPSPIGSTIGIVGGLILGQAAVSANLVSPILIIVVSIAGLGTFATPSHSLSMALSLLKFIYIFLGAIAGFLGIAFGFFVGGAYIASKSSVGVPYLSPFTPKGKTPALSTIFVSPIWKKEKRPSDLKTKDPEKQPHVSRKWRDEK